MQNKKTTRQKALEYCKKGGHADGNPRPCKDAPRCRYLSKDGQSCIATEKSRTYKKPKTVVIVREQGYHRDELRVVKDRQEARNFIRSGVRAAQRPGINDVDEEYHANIEEKRSYKRVTNRRKP